MASSMPSRETHKNEVLPNFHLGSGGPHRHFEGGVETDVLKA